MSSNNAHDELGKRIVLALAPYCRLVPYYVGMVRQMENAEKVFLAGMPGVSDWIGIMTDGSGRFVGLEVKTGKGKLNKDQINFKYMILKNNGIFMEGRSVIQCLAEIRTFYGRYH